MYSHFLLDESQQVLLVHTRCCVNVGVHLSVKQDIQTTLLTSWQQMHTLRCSQWHDFLTTVSELLFLYNFTISIMQTIHSTQNRVAMFQLNSIQCSSPLKSCLFIKLILLTALQHETQRHGQTNLAKSVLYKRLQHRSRPATKRLVQKHSLGGQCSKTWQFCNYVPPIMTANRLKWNRHKTEFIMGRLETQSCFAW